MVKDANVLAIIPARGGSRSIPSKNIRPFAGHPLLAYSIAAGLQADSIDRVIVSTDDERIASIAKQYGAEAPFLRPAEYALDSTPDFPVFEHVLTWLESEEGYTPEIVVQLRPTSPLRPPDCVDRGVKMLIENPNADSVRAVVPSGQNPYKMWRITDRGHLIPLLDNDFKEPYNMPRQELPATYWQTGHLDVFRRETIFEKRSLTGDVVLPLILDPCYSADIDTLNDWERAEWLFVHSDFEVVHPGQKPRPLPEQVELVVFDFDGVMTDNRVWVDEQGSEWVAANRSDGWGIARLKEIGIQVVVLSTEKNPVVAARCAKLGLEVIHGVEDKAAVLAEFLRERAVESNRTIFLGNDVNDVPCFPLVGCALVVSDAHPQARSKADLVLRGRGGQGAVRELCDLLIERHSE